MDPDAETAERPRLADWFDGLWWSRPTAPDVFAFLGAHGAVAARERLGVLLVDQAHRHRTGDPLPIEGDLEKFPEIADDPASKLELVLGEWARAPGDRGAPPSERLIARFPDLCEAILRRAEVDGPWASTAASGAGGGDEVMDDGPGRGSTSGRLPLVWSWAITRSRGCLAGGAWARSTGPCTCGWVGRWPSKSSCRPTRPPAK